MDFDKAVAMHVDWKRKLRMFPNWSMGYRDLANKEVVKTLGYSNFMNTPLTGAEFSQDPNRCMKLLLLFKKNM